MKIPILSRLVFLLAIAVCAPAGTAATPKQPKAAPAPPAAAVTAAAAPAPAAPIVAEKLNIIPIAEIKPGMRGVAYTVFEGVKPEAMEVEVLGVLKNNFNGPKSDVILIRLHGQKVEFTGVVAGMSGSPVYFNGRLAGALAFRLGEFSREPIAGVTPIAEMLEINELDKTIPADSVSGSKAGSGVKPEATKTSMTAPEAPSTAPGYAQYLKPIGAPLVFSGFGEDSIRRFAPQFASAGVMPVMGAGSVSDEKQPEALEPGSSVSALLVRGDMNIAATCTVTYMDPQRLLACGHPLLQFGMVDMPMTKSRVLATLPSPANAFKIVNATEEVGSFVQDRHTGIMGRFDKQPRMIPVTLNVHGGPTPRSYHFEVLSNSKITPLLMMTTVFNSLQSMNDAGDDITFRMAGRISVAGYPDVNLRNMYAPLDSNVPTAFAVAISLGDRFGRIFDNPYSTPNIQGVTMDLDMVRERRFAKLESARTDVTEARPGDQIVVEAVLRPYRGERILRQIPVKVPTSTPKGTLRILISDGDTLDRPRRMSMAYGSRFDLGTTIASLNKDHQNDHLYVSLLEANPQAMIEDKVMPTLPLSVMNVMDGMRGTRDMLITGESAVNEASTPLDYVVSGAQVITVTIK
ncbi:MAG: SpoIVB peptidase S55 [Candidatus Koribacter versatilis]|uniref:SpoIVB peptidase S55 n=1 Tax=Candidatus Korobacter versatilis TaxID=658062 RepID=A0A932AB18_9BACT|nr:SpoIVB peptidase S55 [Candidatus Koribacter versatilis]